MERRLASAARPCVVITNEPLPLAFLADLLGGAFMLTLASFVISLARLDTASPYGGLGPVGSAAWPSLR